MANVTKKKSPVKPVKYEICKNGCMLFPKDDSSVIVCKNEKCKEPRFTNDMNIRREMAMVPVGQQMSMMLSNPKTRELMKYRSQYQSKPSTYEDYFDGQCYKDLQAAGHLLDENEIALAMFVDGFSCTKSSARSKLHIIHFINLNIIPPHLP